MSGPPLSRVVHFLRGTAAPAGGDEDGELLRRFVAAGEEAAFAGLVRRHGTMVLGVCRRLLNDAHEAEDAFQATFLVLARRAATVRNQGSLACWLYGVAYRVSRRAQAAADRRPRTGGTAVEPVSTADPTAEVAGREVRPVIDEELSRLPEKYRAPLVLCYLEGRTNEEAARLLGWTKGTVSGRLARARDLLRSRLVRRGLAPAAGGVGILLAEHTAAPAAALVETTVNAVLAGPRSAPAVALAGGVIRAMFLKKLLTLAALVVVLGIGGGGVGLLLPSAPGDEGPLPKGEPGIAFTLPEEPKKEADDLPILPATRSAAALEGARPKKKPEDLAREAAVRFARAFDERSVDGMMGAAGLPFFYQPKGTPMGSTFGPTAVLRTEKELRARFKEKVAGTLPSDIDRVVLYRDYRTKLLVGPDDRKVLDEVAGNDAWVVFVTKKGETGVVPIVVKVADGQARVVSLLGIWAGKDESGR